MADENNAVETEEITYEYKNELYLKTIIALLEQVLEALTADNTEG